MRHCTGCLCTRKRMLNWCWMGIFNVEDEINYNLCLMVEDEINYDIFLVGKFLGEMMVNFNDMKCTLLTL
ncbi:hypothetical protein Goshw_021482 [Gossypium schwendimanii]|uniref:Uncharacterized protein n=1 Tax=Gossypium schwendimanii TaxID=34291 RepID=A0A7J9KMQ6_GOSSC|nr:hypothetical protein [Gossypium schwendimanii]